MSSIPALSRVASVAVVCIAAVSAPASLASPLFDDDAPLEIELRGPVHSLLKAKKEDAEFPFVITAGTDRSDVEVRTRGQSRLRVCRFPPLRLNFPATVADGSVFAGQNHVKLVTHCNSVKRDADDVLAEYLAYRIFEVLSGYGYRVRLARLTYADTDGREDDHLQGRYGFFIESEDEFSRRTGSRSARLGGVVLSRLDPAQAALVYVFQYLIGNTDWSLVAEYTGDQCCHNIDLYVTARGIRLVPYDFDLSGLVDASYAKPDGSLPIRDVTTRIYRGYCISHEALAGALRRARAREADIRRLADTLPVQAANMEKKVRYLGEFFDDAAQEETMLAGFERRCL